MFADATETYAERPAGMFVYVLDVDKTFKQALEEGGTVVSSVSDQPYGRSGGISDPCGNTWWITSPKQFGKVASFNKMHSALCKRGGGSISFNGFCDFRMHDFI